MKKFRDYFDINELFNPSVFYTGEIILGNINSNLDIMTMNSIKNKGENKYLEFLEKYFYKPFADILNSNSMAHAIPPVISLSDDYDRVRHSRFSFTSYIFARINSSIVLDEFIDDISKFELEYTSKELNDFFVNLLRCEKKAYIDVKNNGEKSKYYNKIFEVYDHYIKMGNNQTFNEFLNGMINTCQKSLIGSRYQLNFFKQDINVNELVDCFEYDKFCLLAAKCVLDNCLFVDKKCGEVHNSINYVINYLRKVKEYREGVNKNYNCTIKVIDPKTKKESISNIDNIIKECEMLLSRHPEFRVYSMTEENVIELISKYLPDLDVSNFDIKSDDALVITRVLMMIEENQSLLASWNIIPKGKVEKVERIPIHGNPGVSLEKEEKIRRMLISKNYLESSNYLFTLRGINEFEGYQGYLYANGMVIFEKYYENIKTRRVASGSATYVMNLNNFVEISKLAKNEIISKINNGDIDGVKRIFHSKDMNRWISKINQTITGSDYTIEVVNKIEQLLETTEITKKLIKR